MNFHFRKQEKVTQTNWGLMSIDVATLVLFKKTGYFFSFKLAITHLDLVYTGVEMFRHHHFI